MIVPGTPRDSPHILDALLNLDGGVKPEMVATDTASYSDMVFGLFKTLGYNFSRRPALPAQAPQPEPDRPLQLHGLHPGRRRPASAARPGRAGAGRGR